MPHNSQSDYFTALLGSFIGAIFSQTIRFYVCECQHDIHVSSNVQKLTKPIGTSSILSGIQQSLENVIL